MSETTAIKTEASAVILAGQERLRIEDDTACREADRFVAETLVPMLKEADSTFKPIISKAHAAWKEAHAQRKRIVEPLEKLKGRLDLAITGYREQERQRIEAERRAEIAARIAAQTPDEPEMGKEAGAEAEAPQAAAPAPVPVQEAPVEMHERTSVRVSYGFEVVDPSAVAAKFLVPDEKKIGALVRSLGVDAEELVGGIKVTRKETLVRR